MNTEKLIAKLKQTQSELDHQRKLPFVLSQIRNKVAKSNTQISSFLKQEQPAICANAQMKVVQGLAMINEMTQRMVSSCRSEHHFELHRHDYLQSIALVERYIEWIYLSLENGYYEIEAAGSTLHASIHLAWQKKKKLTQAIKKPDQYYLSPILNEDLQGQILNFVTQHETFVKDLDQQDKQQHFSRLPWDKMSQANQYFSQLRELNQTIDSARLDFLKQPFCPNFDLAHAFQHVKKLPAKLARFDPAHGKSLGAYQLLEKGRFDLVRTNIDTLLCSFEAYEFFESRLQKKLTKPEDWSDEKIKALLQFEKKQLNYFSSVFKKWEEDIVKLGAFMVDLQILIGKIWRSLEFSGASWEFLQKTVTASRKLVERSINLVQSWQESATTVEQALVKSTLLPKMTSQMSQNFASELSQIETMLNNYLKSFHRYTVGSFESFESPSEAFEALASQEDVEQISTQIHVVLLRRQSVLQEIFFLKAFYQQLPDECSLEDLQDHVEKSLKIRLTYLQKKWKMVLRLEWFIDDLLTDELSEMYRFEQDYDRWIQPMLEKSRVKSVTAGLSKEEEQEADPLNTAEIEGINQTDEKKDSPKLKLNAKQKKVTQSPYLPFQPEILYNLKRVCHHLASERALGILEILEKPHTFFNYLDHLLEQYDPEAPFKENYYLANLGVSDTAMEFLLSFAEMKFLPYGYYTSNSEKIPFCPETRQFNNNGQEMYLRISARTIETPRVIFVRILKMLLGFEDPEVLNIDDNQKLIDALKIEYILTEDEQAILHQEVPYLA